MDCLSRLQEKVLRGLDTCQIRSMYRDDTLKSAAKFRRGKKGQTESRNLNKALLGYLRECVYIHRCRERQSCVALFQSLLGYHQV